MQGSIHTILPFPASMHLFASPHSQSISISTPQGERYLAERGPPADRERFGSEPRDVAPGRDRDRDRDFRGPPPPHGREEGPPPRPMLDPLEQLAMDLPPPHVRLTTDCFCVLSVLLFCAF